MTRNRFYDPPRPRHKLLASRLAELIDEPRLRYIAKADRGDDFDAHLAAVRALRDTLDVPAILEWVPREVLELVRWSRPEDWYAERDVDYRMVYETRAFCCSILLLSGEDSESFDSVAETLGNLMESLIRFTPELLEFVPDALGHWENFDFHPADHSFRLAAELYVWLELEHFEKIGPALEALLEMEALARTETPPRAKHYGQPVAFAGVRSLIQAHGWNCVGKMMADRAMIVRDEEQRFYIENIAAALSAIKTPKRG